MTSPIDHRSSRLFRVQGRRRIALSITLALLLAGQAAYAGGLSGLKRVFPLAISRYLHTPWPDGGDGQNIREVPLAERVRVLVGLQFQTGTRYGFLLSQLPDLRARTLPFYLDAVLYEGRIQNAAGNYERLAFIRHRQGFTVLTGESAPIHALNSAALLHLETEAQAKAYLRFFCDVLQSKAGDTFSLVEQPHEMPWADGADPVLRQTVERQLKPLALRRDDHGLWQAEGMMLYWNKLYDIAFEVASNGEVKIRSEHQKTDVLPLQAPLLLKGVQAQ